MISTVLAAAALTAGPAVAQDLTLRFASLYLPEHAASRTADKFAELVKEKTGGSISVDVFHNAALGGEREAAEGVHSGSIDVAYSGLGGFGSYVPQFGVIELPFNFQSLDQLKTIVDQISDELETRMAQQGFVLLGYLYDGPRVTLSTRPLKSIDDFKGLKLRVPQAPLYVKMAEALGAAPTPVALPEVYTALQFHVAEALEGTPTSIYVSKYHEVAHYIARTDHIFFVAYIAMNKALFDSLTPDQQKALREAGHESSAYNLEIAKEAVGHDLERLAADGVIFNDVDLKPFKQAVAKMKDDYAAGLGPDAVALYNKIKSLGAN